MSMFRNVMVFLGLGPDEEYDDSYLYDDSDEAAPDGGQPGPPKDGRDRSGGQWGPKGTGVGPVAGSGVTPRPTGEAVSSVRSIRAVADDDTAFRVRAMSSGDSDERSIQPVPLQRSKPRTISPQSFGDAKILADEFKRGTPVVMNLQAVDRDLARRLIDFASGVCYSLGGAMEKLATNVFLLIPKGIQVSDDDRRRIDERGFDR